MKILSTIQSQKGFTLIELIIGMTIFSVSLTAILALLHSTISSSHASREEIVVANLLREQVELVKNLRNTNVRNFVEWDSARVELSPLQSLTGGFFIIENNFDVYLTSYNSDGKINTSPVKLYDISQNFPGTLETIFNRTRLSLDTKGRYTHDAGIPTKYASHVRISPLIISANGQMIEPKVDGKNQGYIIDARVIVNSRGTFREYDLKTVITDWKN